MPAAETRAGRPRDPGRDVAILSATLDLLGEVGYEDVTVRAISQRSGTGLATLYRRWPTKDELVVDAVATTFPPELLALDEGGDPVDNVVRIAAVLVDMLQGRHPRLVPNLLGQMAANAALAEVVRGRIIAPRIEAVATQLDAVPGVEPGRARQLAELIPGWILLRVLVLGQRVDEADLRHLVRTVAGLGR